MTMIKRAWSQNMGTEPLVQVVQAGEMVKTASHAVPEIKDFLASLTPDLRYTYVLVNAMGYSEFFGANSNKDYYGHNPHLNFNGLLNAPPDWGCDPCKDMVRGKKWLFGYPTYYGASVYAHHKNSDPNTLGFGDVIFVMPNHRMKRIELVMRVDNALAHERGRTSILDRIRNHERVEVSMGCKVPFDLCLHPATLIRCADGWTPAKDIKIGTSVLTHRGRYRAVTRKFIRDTDEDLFEINADGVPQLQVTATHPMYVVRGGDLRTCRGSMNGRRRRCSPDENGVCSFCDKNVVLVPQWIPAEEVRLTDYLVAPKGSLGKQAVDPARARLLGYWIGDGHRLRQRTGKKKDGDYHLMGFGFTVGYSEESHLERLLKTISEVSSGTANVYESGMGRRAYQIHTYDQATASWLMQYGADEEYKKRLHEDVYTWDRAALLELLGGWIDTDGHFGNHVRIATSRHELALDGQRLLRLLGVPSGITINQTERGPVYQFSIQRDHVLRLQLWRYTEKVSKRDFNRVGGPKLLIVGDWALHPVRSVMCVKYSGEVVNFSVDEDESYVAEGVATHNCSICTDWNTLNQAWRTFDPGRHLHPGLAILQYHKGVAPIRGLSITRADYCACMRLHPGQILPDGQKVFVFNDFPRFFDISFVWIGADKTARVMWSMGSGAPEYTPSLIRSDPFGMSQNQHLAVKSAMEKCAGSSLFFKRGEIEKEIPALYARKVELCAAQEPDLPFDLLNGATDQFGIKSVLSTLASLGIVLKPREFHMVVTRGRPLSEKLAGLALAKGSEFDTTVSEVDDTHAVDGVYVDDSLARVFSPAVTDRSSFAPHLERRIQNIPSGSVLAKEAGVLTSDLMNGLAAQYNGYRLSILENAPSVFPKYARIWNLDTDDLLKVGSLGLAPLLLGLGPVIHLVSAHLRRKREAGEEIGTMAKFVADNPTFLTMSTIGAGLRAVLHIQKAGGLGAAAKGVLSALRALA